MTDTVTTKFNTLDDLEKQRKAVMFIYIAAISMMTVGTMSFYFLPFLIGECSILIASPFSLYFIWGGSVFLFIWATNKKRRYAKMFKKCFILDSLRSTFSDLVFDVDNGLPESVIADTGMMRLGNRYFTDDYISGRYKNVPFEQADVCIQQHTSSGKSSSTVTYFKGRWMVFRFNKNFVCNLQVREKGFNYAKKTGGFFSGGDTMNRIELEDEEFNSAFKVFAVSEEEAYYILTPQLMRKMIELRDRTHGKLLLCFVDNKLHVACNSGKNAFEPPVFQKIDIESLMNDAFEEINLITRFVDELNLDMSLFKR